MVYASMLALNFPWICITFEWINFHFFTVISPSPFLSNSVPAVILQYIYPYLQHPLNVSERLWSQIRRWIIRLGCEARKVKVGNEWTRCGGSEATTLALHLPEEILDAACIVLVP